MTNIEFIDLEISNYCNAACSKCLRATTQQEINNSYLDYQFLVDTLSVKNFPNLKKIRFCGNVGDPLTHKDLLLIIEHIRRTWNRCYIDIRTNGGLRDTSTWTELGHQLNSDTTGAVWFGIDGDQTTNQLYRKNVMWSQLIKNVDTFINAGGRAILQFIPFDWNIHQLPDMIEFAKNFGFSKFVTRISHRNEKKINNMDFFLNNYLNLNYPTTELESAYINSSGHECYSKIQNSIFISANKKLYPCCLLGENEYNNLNDLIFLKIINQQNISNNINQDNLIQNYEQSVLQVYQKLNTNSACSTCDARCRLPFKSKDWFVLVDFENSHIYYDYGQVSKTPSVFL